MTTFALASVLAAMVGLLWGMRWSDSRARREGERVRPLAQEALRPPQR